MDIIKRNSVAAVVALALWGYLLPAALMTITQSLDPTASPGLNVDLENTFDFVMQALVFLTPLSVACFLNLDHRHRERLARIQLLPITIVILFAAYHLYHYPTIQQLR